MKYYKNAFYFFIIIILILLNSCSRTKPILKKKLSECTSRDLLEYSRALFKEDFYEEAIEEYKKVIALFPNDKIECSWAQYELAYSYYYMEEYEKALKEFRKVNMLYPNQLSPNILTKNITNEIYLLLY